MTGLRLHHVGIAVSEIEKHARVYINRFGYIAQTGIVHDPVQTAFVQFFRLPGQEVLLEFVAPDGPESKLANAVAQRGGGLNHLCYAVADIESTCRELVGKGMALVQPPTAAVAFDLRRIAWLLGRERVLFELVEAGPEGSL